MSVRNKLVIFIIVLLVLDQAVKIWIKTHMMIGEEFSVFGNWFKILFIENNGMAFGMELGDGKFGKAVLSLFRLVAVAANKTEYKPEVPKIIPRSMEQIEAASVEKALKLMRKRP